MNRQEKREQVADFHSRLEKAQGTFLVDYQGLDVQAINRLRSELRDVKTEFQVVKNRLLKLASEGTDTMLMEDHMQGPTAIAITHEEVVAPAKVLMVFAKEFKQLSVKSGQISGRVVDGEAIKRLAELPGRDILLAQTLATIQTVPASFVRVLNGLIGQLLNVLKALEQKECESALE